MIKKVLVLFLTNLAPLRGRGLWADVLSEEKGTVYHVRDGGAKEGLERYGASSL